MAASHRFATTALIAGCSLYILLLWGPPLEWGSFGKASPLRAAALAYTFGLLFPVLWLLAANRKLSEFGLRRPNEYGFPLTAWAAIPCIALGFWLSRAVSRPWEGLFYEGLELASMIPQHFLLFGILIALSRETRRLPDPPKSLFSLSRSESLGLAVSTLLFLAIHLGSPHVAEMIWSVPFGFLFAFMTLKSGSVWPAIFLHWVLNIIPLGWDLVTGRGVG